MRLSSPSHSDAERGRRDSLGENGSILQYSDVNVQHKSLWTRSLYFIGGPRNEVNKFFLVCGTG